MPINEDEYEQHKQQQQQQQQHVLSKAEQRRSNKPIMEKRRRARINHCLNELKSLILDAMKKDPARHSKLEKADILEMTVKHLQSIQRQQLAVAVATDPAVLHKFKTGFNECAGEVSRYIGRMEGVEPAVKQRLVAHLAHCVTGLQQLTPFTFPGVVPPPQTQQQQSLAGDVNNNRGLQLIPSRLPSGEFALLLPNGNQLPGIPFFPAPPQPAPTVTSTNTSSSTSGPTATVTSGSIVDRSHPSAFTAVLTRSTSPTHVKSTPPTSLTHSSFSQPTSQNHHSPPLSPTSSVSSCEDGSFTSEPYLSPNSPPLSTATLSQNHHQTQTTNATTFPLMVPFHSATLVDSSHFKIPLVNQTATFRTFSGDVHKSQQHLAASVTPKTEPSPGKQPMSPVSTNSTIKNTASVGVGTFTEVKLEFKTIPMSAASIFPIISSSSVISPTNHTPATVVAVSTNPSLQQPLSVITSQERPVIYKTTLSPIDAQPTQCFRIKKEPPLDFSLKKDDFLYGHQSASTQTLSGVGNKRSLSAAFSASDHSNGDNVSASSLSVALASPSKVPRFSFHVSSSNDTLPSAPPTNKRILDDQEIGDSLLKCMDNKRHLSHVVEDLSNKASTSTVVTATVAPTMSTSTSATATTASNGGNKDMWRPW